MNSNVSKNFVLTIIISCIAIICLLILPFYSPLDGETGSDWAIFFGRFHIVILHLPIGWLVLLPILEILNVRSQSRELHKAIRIILTIAAFSSIFVVLAGFTLASSEGYTGKTVETHMWFGIATSIATILAFLSYEATQFLRHTLFRKAYLAFIAMALFAVTTGGHLGGALVQGEGYLTEKLPTQLKIQLGLEKQAITPSFETPIYASLIEPIFQQRCFSCHSDAKVKSQFNIQHPENLFIGGKSKRPAIVANNTEKSELIHRINLPRDDKKFMPPEGRSPINTQQETLIRWWISIGAPLSKSINELKADQFPKSVRFIIEEIIATAENKNNTRPVYTELPRETIENALKQLKQEFGVDIYPISQNPKDGLHLGSINFNRSLENKAWLLLQPLTDFIYAIDLGGMTLSEGSFEQLSHFRYLHTLLLNSTKIQDNSIAPLAKLKKLKRLNLFNTNIEDSQLAALDKMLTLKDLYLTDTNTSTDKISELQIALKHTNIYSHHLAEPINSDDSGPKISTEKDKKVDEKKIKNNKNISS